MGFASILMGKLRFFLRSRDFCEKYAIHCHNDLYEDHAMMFRFDVVGDS
jgi:hypothetical protein